DIEGAPTQIRLETSPDEAVNVIAGAIADPENAWQVREYPEIRDDNSISLIGENRFTLDLPFTVDHRRAQRIAKIEMHRANARKMLAADYWLKALILQPGDIVTQSYARYGFAGDTMRVAMW